MSPMLEGVNMPKMTKTQIKRALYSIENKAYKIALNPGKSCLPMKDALAIERIVHRALDKLKS